MQEMHQPIKVLALIEGKDVNGAAKPLIQFCTSVQENGQDSDGFPVDITLATYHRHSKFEPFSYNSAPPNQLVQAFWDNHIPYYVIGERFLWDPRIISSLRRIVELSNPNILHTNNTKSHFLARISGINRKTPWIAFHHGYTSANKKDILYSKLDRWSLRGADRVITVCKPFAEMLRGMGVREERIHVVHSSIDPDSMNHVSPEKVARLKSELGITPDERVILSVGRLSKEKGHADLLEALRLLKAKSPNLDWKLVLVGDGPERMELEKQAILADIKDRIVFAGHLGDVAPYYAIADVFVLPSHSEGSPNALLEAMAAKVPIVATTVGGVPEIVTDGESALLTPPHDPKSFSLAIWRMLEDTSLGIRLKEFAYQTACKIYSPQARMINLFKFYASHV